MSSMSEKFRDFRASKGTLFWSCAGCIVATMIIGFTWGGWTTAGSAAERAEEAAEQAVAQLAADICVNRYLASPDVRTHLTAFNEESVYRRDGLIEDGGWVTFAGMEDPVDGAAELCADQLAEVDMSALPEVPVAEATTVPATEITAVQ
jgi:hypothetical protein